MTGNKGYQREKETEREKGLWREGERNDGERKQHRSFQKMAQVDLTVGLNQHLGNFQRRQSIEQQGGVVNQDQGGFQHSIANLAQQHSLE